MLPTKLISSFEKLTRSLKIGHLSFLTDTYKREVYYYEVIECVRRLSLAAAIGLANQESIVAAVVGMIICFGFVTVIFTFNPYRYPDDHNLAITLSNSLAIVFLSALLIKVCQ